MQKNIYFYMWKHIHLFSTMMKYSSSATVSLQLSVFFLFSNPMETAWKYMQK